MDQKTSDENCGREMFLSDTLDKMQVHAMLIIDTPSQALTGVRAVRAAAERRLTKRREWLLPR
jgi:hypothetical protein